MTVDFAVKSEKERLAELWKSCFGDDDEYISGFFENRFAPEDTLVVREDGAVRAMLFLLCGSVRAGGESFSAAYIYAACTQEEYRGRGYMASLLDMAARHCTDKGLDFLCLVPAQDSLFGYYEKHGYRSAFEEKILFLSRRQLGFVAAEETETGELTAREMSKVRAAALASDDCFVWDEDALRYALLENRLGGGGDVACFENGRCSAYALFYEENEKLIIRECAVRKGAFRLLARALLGACESDVFFFHLPLDFPLSADKFQTRYNAMLLPLNGEAETGMKDMKNAYMGLTLG